MNGPENSRKLRSHSGETPGRTGEKNREKRENPLLNIELWGKLGLNMVKFFRLNISGADRHSKNKVFPNQ